jgi:hypothetical protein
MEHYGITNERENNLRNVRLENVALSDETGKALLAGAWQNTPGLSSPSGYRS